MAVLGEIIINSQDQKIEEVFSPKQVEQSHEGIDVGRLVIFRDFRNDLEGASAVNVEPGEMYFAIVGVKRQEIINEEGRFDSAKIRPIIKQSEYRMSNILRALNEFSQSALFEATFYAHSVKTDTLVVKIEPHRL